MKAPSSPPGTDSMKHRTVLPRFRDAFAGVMLAYREEPNLRFHLFAGICAAIAGFAVRLQGWEAAYLALTVVTVMIAEMVNTAVERAVDLAAAGRCHPLAAQAKEVAAGAVLLASLHAAFAAGFLFLVLRGLSESVNAVAGLLSRAPWVALFPLAAAVAGLLGGRAQR